ncbi:hypothetical protein ACFX12_043393 [Malus domestica]
MRVFDVVCKLTVFAELFHILLALSALREEEMWKSSANTVSLHTASKTRILGFYKRSILENSETLSGCMRSSITPLANLTSSFRITRKILALCFPCPEHILDNLHAVTAPFRRTMMILVVPFYDQRTVVSVKDAAWTMFCGKSTRHFNRAFSHKIKHSLSFWHRHTRKFKQAVLEFIGCRGSEGYSVSQVKNRIDQSGDSGSGGITIKKTSQALLIGIYDEPVTPGQCNIVVERLGDYLIEQGL